MTEKASEKTSEHLDVDIRPLEQHMHQHHDAPTPLEVRKIALDSAIAVSINRASVDPAFHRSHLSPRSIIELADAFDAFIQNGTVPAEEAGDE